MPTPSLTLRVPAEGAVHWFFTWRTYGTWLPGVDGFVGHYHADGRRTIDHAYGDATTRAIPALERYARGLLKTAPVSLDRPEAEAVAAQLHETARHRGRPIDALAVLVTHVHLVFATPDEPDPDLMLADWKAYASRPLNRLAGGRGDWWAAGGSKRRLLDDDARPDAIRYVRDQQRPLVVWLSDEAERLVMQEPGA